MKKNNLFFLKFSLVAMVFSLSITAAYAQGTLSGKVSDANGKSLTGVYITVKGQSGGGISETDGSYSLSVPAGT